MKFLTKLALAWLAVILALWGCIGTNLINGWGLWYGGQWDMAYRHQTDALMEGRVALTDTPTGLEHDYAWGAGAVQQVWGLGVPAWRLPFEAAGRIFGQQGFPDRIALAAAWALTIYMLLVAFLAPVEAGVSWLGHIARHPERLAVVGLLSFFPPILFLADGEFRIYEEPVFYGYLYSVALFAGLIAFSRRPTFPALLALSMLSGLAAFFRPTAGAYGFASTILACLLTRRFKWPWWQTIAGLVPFGVGSVLLYLSNRQRFGSGVEFGHTLNQTLNDLIFPQRFGGPYGQEPFWPAFKELVGSIFFVKDHSNALATYANDLVLWQTSTPRWREYYKATFDGFMLAGMLFCWARATWSGVAAAIRKRMDALDTELLLTAAWTIISFVPLCGFYLRFHAVSSRYWDDFAGCVAVGMIGGLTMKWRPGILSYAARFVALGVVVGWWNWEMTNTRTGRGPDVTNYYTALNYAQRGYSPVGRLPTRYQGGRVPSYGIFRNGVGWNNNAASVYYMVVLFFDSPQRLAVEVAPAPGQNPTEDDYKAIRAKVGLEYLKLDSIKDTPNGKILRFAGPQKEAYRHGPQMISLGFVRSSEFMRLPGTTTRFRLLQVTTDENP